jgi:glutamate-1-semialdehyde 2,1-aminomutase
VKFAAFYHAMRERGILLAPSQNEVMFLSVAHADADVEETIAATAASLEELRASGIV